MSTKYVNTKSCFGKVLTPDLEGRVTIGRPMTPGNFTGESKIVPISVISTTKKDDMFDSHSELFCERISYKSITSDKEFITVKLLDGTTRLVNKNYIVMVNNAYSAVLVDYNNENSAFKLGLWRFDYLIKDKDFEDVVFTDEYMSA